MVLVAGLGDVGLAAAVEVPDPGDAISHVAAILRPTAIRDGEPLSAERLQVDRRAVALAIDHIDAPADVALDVAVRIRATGTAVGRGDHDVCEAVAVEVPGAGHRSAREIPAILADEVKPGGRARIDRGSRGGAEIDPCATRSDWRRPAPCPR